MIERMPQSLASQVRILSRLSSTSSQSFRSPIRLNPRPFPSIPSHHRPRRPYANYAPNNSQDPLQPIPQQSSHGINQAPTQNLQQDSSNTSAPFATNFQPPPPPPPKPKRSLRPFIYATIFFTIGAASGQYVRYIISPLPLPTPNTPDDALLTTTIKTMATNLPLVKSLSENPAWRSWDAYSIFTPLEKEHRITSGPLGGARGLGGYQRIFHNESTGEFISVVWIGGALAGWPGVVHGGLIAKLLDESMGRCAISRFPVKTGVTANLEIQYRKPTVTNGFYVIRCKPIEEGSTERKSYVRGTLEMMNGLVCVEAKGLFVLPKNLENTSLALLERRSNVGF
jgi:acyl-coenzyme A thioesterase PaaI-like protein